MAGVLRIHRLAVPLLLLSLAACTKKAGIEGIVADGRGQPIPDAKIIALQQQPVKGYARFETTTGADGRFRFDSVYPASEYRLLISTDAFGMREVRFTSGAASTTQSLGAPVVFRFQTSPDGIVLDTKTGLQWAPDPGKTMTWHEAKRFTRSLKLGDFRDWRMPTRAELLTLSGIGAEFPLNECCAWSSEARDARRAWYVNVYQSFVENALMSNRSYALLAVRTPE